MHLSRVRVPNFRVLKDVDITFEDYFSPRFFPLASINGGGKSTLLQLIFILLHCSPSKKDLDFVKNILSFVEMNDVKEITNIISLEFKDEHEIVDLTFSLIPVDKFLLDWETWLEKQENNTPKSFDYSVLDIDFNDYVYSDESNFLEQVKEIHQEILILSKTISQFLSKRQSKSAMLSQPYFNSRMKSIEFLKLLPFISYETLFKDYNTLDKFKDYLAQLEQKYAQLESKYNTKKKHKKLHGFQ